MVERYANFNENVHIQLETFQLLIIEIARANAYYTHLSLLFNLTPLLCIYILNNKNYERKSSEKCFSKKVL